MSYMCTRVMGRECDCCGDCVADMLGLSSGEEETQRRCAECGATAVNDGYYYDVEGMTLCIACVDKLYRREA